MHKTVVGLWASGLHSASVRCAYLRHFTDERILFTVLSSLWCTWPYIVHHFTLKWVFLLNNTQIVTIPSSVVPLFSGLVPCRKAHTCNVFFFFTRDKEATRLNTPPSVTMFVYMFFLTAWISLLEMQYLQMCLLNCSCQLLQHAGGTIETKPLKQLSFIGCRFWCMGAPDWSGEIFHRFNTLYFQMNVYKLHLYIYHSISRFVIIACCKTWMSESPDNLLTQCRFMHTDAHANTVCGHVLDLAVL